MPVDDVQCIDRDLMLIRSIIECCLYNGLIKGTKVIMGTEEKTGKRLALGSLDPEPRSPSCRLPSGSPRPSTRRRADGFRLKLR